MFVKKIVSILFVFLFLARLDAALLSSLPDDEDILDAMQEHDVQGTMIISSEDNQIIYIFDAERAHTPLSPASTFKIANSMIAIEEGVLKDQYEMIKWDGEKRFFDAWNQDQNLKSAFKSSCVWFYQELAKKIGGPKYEMYFELFDYGNQLLGDDITTFWLEGEGDLRITPLEQIDFLKGIYHRTLPISARTYAILQDVMLEEEGSDYQIYSKTGSATKNWIGHGWYVGYVTVKNETWFFVTNILIDGMKDLPKRKAVTIAVLNKKGII